MFGKGVKKVNQSILQDGRTLIITKDDVPWEIIPDGTLRVDPDNGQMFLKIKGEGDWLPAGISNDGTITIAKDAVIIYEVFTIKNPDNGNSTFTYTNQNGENRTKPLTQEGQVFELEKGNYILSRNKISAVINGTHHKITANNGLKEIDEIRIALTQPHPAGTVIAFKYYQKINIGNPYPRVFFNRIAPPIKEHGDLWIDTSSNMISIIRWWDAVQGIWRTTFSEENLNSHIANTRNVHGATSDLLPERVVTRDSSGRARFASPLAPDDAANRAFVENAVAGLAADGIPRLNMWQYLVTATTNNQTVFIIPSDTYERNSDSLLVYKNTTFLPNNNYEITNAVYNASGIIQTRGFITLGEGVQIGTQIAMILLKNTPMGPEGMINGISLAVNSIPENRIRQITVSDTTAPTGNTGSLQSLFDWISNRIRVITGENSWRTNPATTLRDVVPRAAASDQLGTMAYNGHTRSDGRIYGGASAPSAITRLNYDGYFYATRVYNAFYNDYAEFFLKGDDLEPGDIVALCRDSEKELYIKSTKEFEPLVVGVVSDDFAQCIGGEGSEHDEIKYAPVGLAGRARVKIVGSAQRGDFVVSSVIPGVGKAIKPDKYIPGTVIGKVLENYDGENGIQRIKILIQNL